MSDSATPRTVARQAPLFIGFPRQEYGSGLPFPSPRDLPDPRIEPTSPVLAGRLFTTEPREKPSWALRRETLTQQIWGGAGGRGSEDSGLSFKLPSDAEVPGLDTTFLRITLIDPP